MLVEQINIGKRTPLLVNGETRETGIFKEWVAGPVLVGTLGLQGDAICNTKHHGGPDQAVYLYSVEDYSFWGGGLAGPIPPGTFGENLTVSGVDLVNICVGDVLFSNQVTLQVTAPRIPCSTLTTRMGDKQFAKKFIQAGRSGAYCRVLQAGEVSPGAMFEHRPFEGERISLVEFFGDAHRKLTADELRRYLAAPIDERSRADFTAKLAR
jgi:MOSC domain-containing protein YiiM